MLNFAICDDNLNILDKMSKMLESIFTKNELDAKVALASNNVDKVLDYIYCNKTDVLFLDINLRSSKTGLEIAEAVRQKNKNIYIIFTTAHLEYAMVAYKFKTFDYLVKPITYERLEETIMRLYDDIYSKPKKYLKIDNKNTIVDQSEIKFIKRDGMKLIFHTTNKDYEIYSSFNKIQDSLPENFVRCHKSFIANIDNISNIEPVENKIFFDNDFYCDIGPKYKKDLLEAVNKYGDF